MPNQQIPLAVGLSDQARFENFYAGESNQAAVHSLREFSNGLGEVSAFLFGPDGSGKSHLLQALCHLDRDALYFPLKDMKGFEPAELEALPESKQSLYNWQRNSAVLTKTISSPAR